MQSTSARHLIITVDTTGNFATCHLAAKVERFEFVEWDHATTPGIDDSSYSISNGYVNVPDLPGFGLRIDEGPYQKALEENGFIVNV